VLTRVCQFRTAETTDACIGRALALVGKTTKKTR
jgi:hypothetical protein